MTDEATNEGSFEIIAAIGKGNTKPLVTDQPEAKPIDEANEAELERLQQEYLWNCTFH